MEDTSKSRIKFPEIKETRSKVKNILNRINGSLYFRRQDYWTYRHSNIEYPKIKKSRDKRLKKVNSTLMSMGQNFTNQQKMIFERMQVKNGIKMQKVFWEKFSQTCIKPVQFKTSLKGIKDLNNREIDLNSSI